MKALRRTYERGLAGLSLVAAIAIAFTALLIRNEHNIEAGVAMVIAQFLTLTGTLLGIDYKFHGRQYITPRDSQ